jgi:sugar lactone lactonase YvrE
MTFAARGGLRGMSEPRIVRDGLVMGESPRWHEGRLWVSDWGAREVLAIGEDGGAEVVVADGPELPACIDWLPDGRLLVVAGREGRLLRREHDGALVTHADLTTVFAPPWNDIVVDARGNVFVNCAGFDFPGGEFAPGRVAVVTPDGAVREVADGLAFPNGMAVTADDSTLIVAESYGARLTAFDIAPDGGLSGRRVWAELGDAAPDGICVDADGAVWYADVPNTRCVRVREGGEVLATVVLDRGCFACMLGGADGRTLFIVASEWRGADRIADEAGTGIVAAVEAPAARAGRP